MFEKNECRWRKSIERASEKSVDGPKSGCDHDKKRSERHMVEEVEEVKQIEQ